jgi:hypothetical protein
VAYEYAATMGHQQQQVMHPQLMRSGSRGQALPPAGYGYDLANESGWPIAQPGGVAWPQNATPSCSAFLR